MRGGWWTVDSVTTDARNADGPRRVGPIGPRRLRAGFVTNERHFFLYANYDVVARGDVMRRLLARRRDGRDV